MKHFTITILMSIVIANAFSIRVFSYEFAYAERHFIQVKTGEEFIVKFKGSSDNKYYWNYINFYDSIEVIAEKDYQDKGLGKQRIKEYKLKAKKITYSYVALTFFELIRNDKSINQQQILAVKVL